MANRTRSPRGLEPKNRVLIVCEGETEKEYFDGYRQDRRLGSLVALCVEGDPKTILNEARKRSAAALKDRDPFDLVCCVFDCDGRPHIGEVHDDCTAENYVVGYSNPSFELWGILHFEYTSSPMNQKQAEKRLKKHLPSYDKGMRDVYKELTSKAKADPRENALELDKHHETASAGKPAWDRNPATAIHSVLDKLGEAFPD